MERISNFLNRIPGYTGYRDKENRRMSLAQPHRTSPYVNAGLGFQSVINDRWSFQADVRSVYGFIGSDDFRHDRSNNVYATVGFNYALGPAPQPPAPPAPPPPPPEKPAEPIVELTDKEKKERELIRELARKGKVSSADY